MSMPVPTTVIERLKAVVGPGGYIEGEAESTAYTRPWRGSWEGRSPLVLRPRTTDEVAAIVKICAESRTPIVPQGGNTGVTYGGLPAKDMSELVVSTARMRAIRDVDLVNDTMTVEAGVVLKDIQTGAFTSEWMRECRAGQAKFKATRRMNDAHPIEEVGARLRDMMPWIKSKALVDKSKN